MSITLVCGPPCAGKTTYALEHAGPDTVIVDHDLIAQQLGSTRTHNHEQHLREGAERQVSRMIEALELAVHTGAEPDAIVVRTLGNPAKRQALADRLRASVVLLTPDRPTLEQRAAQRPDPAETLQAIDAWHTQPGLPTTKQAGATKGDPRQTRAWRKLRDQVVREEPTCWLQLPGICTAASTTADHVQPVKARPDLALVRSNLRGACEPCNRARGNTPVESLRLVQDQPPALSIFG